MLVQELSDRTGKAWQELAALAAGQPMVSGLHDLLGGQALLGGRGRTADTEQPPDLGHLQSGVAVQQDVAEQPRGVVIATTALAELECHVQNLQLRGGQVLLRDVRFYEPGSERLNIRAHGGPSVAAGAQDSIVCRSRKVTPKGRKTVWC